MFVVESYAAALPRALDAERAGACQPGARPAAVAMLKPIFARESADGPTSSGTMPPMH
jgi:hypothetical protein